MGKIVQLSEEIVKEWLIICTDTPPILTKVRPCGG
jgi:hypothetical protein